MSTFFALKCCGIIRITPQTDTSNHLIIFSNFHSNEYSIYLAYLDMHTGTKITFKKCVFNNNDKTKTIFENRNNNNNPVYVYNCIFNGDIKYNNGIVTSGNSVNQNNINYNVIEHYAHKNNCPAQYNENNIVCDEEGCENEVGCNANDFDFGANDVPYETPSPSFYFSETKEFSETDYFSKSQFFTNSKKFEQTNFFSKSFAFSETKDFTKTDMFSESKKFSGSSYFTKSSFFIGTNDFTKSADFTTSFYFSKSAFFSKTNDFSKTTYFTESTGFTVSHYFTKSSFFIGTNDFTKSADFTTSFYFSKSAFFSKTNDFSKTTYFTESTGFTVSHYFTKSDIFSDSYNWDRTSQFTRSNTFTPSGVFSTSFYFSNSNSFTKNELYTESTNEFTLSSVFIVNKSVIINIKQDEAKQANIPLKIGIGVTCGIVAIAALIIVGLFFLRKRKLAGIEDIDEENVILADDVGNSTITHNPLNNMMNNDDPFEDEFD